MISDQRIFYSDNGVLSDYSTALDDFRQDAAAIPFVAAEDYLYIGSFLPFNHKWFEVNTVNDQASAIDVDVWDGQQWIQAVDIIDSTSVGGVALSKSGLVRWTTDREENWAKELDSFDVLGLENTKVYELYWARFTYTGDLNAATALDFVGQKFSNDNELYSWYPDLNQSNLKVAFQAGKTNWDEQHFAAARVIVQDLKRANIVVTADQVLEPDLFQEASIHKCAEIIYGAFGDAYKDNMARARDKYKETLNLKYFQTDRNADARLSGRERGLQTSLRR